MEIELVKGDITRISCDAIVNAANSSLLGGGGVDGAIHRIGGKRILEDCMAIRNRQGGCEVGQAVITTAGNLPAKYVIHTVGPKWNDGKSQEAEKLRQCYINSLSIARDYRVGTIAFPNISTGIYRFPKEKAASIAITTVKENPMVEKVIFVCFDEQNHGIYKKFLGDE